MIESQYQFYLDSVYSEMGLIIDAPAAPDKCAYADDAWGDAVAAYNNALCDATRLKTREELDDWLMVD